MEAIKERVGAYLMRERKTKSELSQELGMSTRTLHDKLVGNVEFRLSEAIKLADILGCKVDDFRKAS